MDIELRIKSHGYFSKKFLGLVISFDFHRPKTIYDPIFLFEIKLFWIGYWLTIDKKPNKGL